MIFVYLVLVGQYESFVLPLAVILSLPVGIFGSFLFLQSMGLINDHVEGCVVRAEVEAARSAVASDDSGPKAPGSVEPVAGAGAKGGPRRKAMRAGAGGPGR